MAGEPPQHCGADIGKRTIVAGAPQTLAGRPPAQHLAGHGQERSVLASVIGPRVSRIHAVIGCDDQQVAIMQTPQQARQIGVDIAQGAIEAPDVLAVTVDLVGLDQIGEQKPLVQPSKQDLGALEGLCVRRARVRLGDSNAGEQIPILPIPCTSTPALWSSSR